MTRLGLITYDNNHLKTEQLVLSYTMKKEISSINIYALPFKTRKSRKVIFNHRPEMTGGVHPKELAAFEKVNFHNWDGIGNISNENDIFVIGGAGILDIKFAKNKPIVNAHPGIIPITRGLDAFKWAIFNGAPVGVTIHLIDSEVDKGEIIKIQKTKVFKNDTIESLARRHYEMEIDLLSNILNYKDQRLEVSEEEYPAKLRMTLPLEKQMLERFDQWKREMIE